MALKRFCVPKMALLAAGLGVLFCTGLFAQQMVLSTIRGNALDQSGAAVPGVTITLTNLETSATRSVSTGETGEFEIPYIQRGTYKLTATISGFKTFIADNIILESGQIRRVDVRLEVGGSQTEITVQANAAVITTEGASISGTITAPVYDEIPMVANWFDPTLVMVTMPGIVAPIGGSYSIQFNGQSSSQLSEGMDGITYDGPVNQVNNIEDVSELLMVTTSAPAEYSRAGNFNLVSKGGGNQYHGRLYYTHQNGALNAREYFSPGKTKYLVHTFGAHMGGPIIKDKLFFYATWNAHRVPSHFFARAAVPTAGMRNGDFSSLLPDIVIADPFTGVPFPGNKIPTSRLNATSLKTQDLYIPKPNLGGAEFLGENLGWTHPKAQDAYKQDYLMQRIDYNLSKDNTLFGRFTVRVVPYYLPGGLPNFAWTRNRHHSNLVLSDTHVFTPKLVNTFRFGWIKDFYEDGREVAGFTPPNGNDAVKAIGLEGVNPKGYSAMGFPTMSIAGFSALSQTAGGIAQDARDLSYADSVTWSFDKHVMKFGGELKSFREFTGTVPDGTYGSFGFEGNFTGFAYADFLLGLPNTSFRLNPLTNRTKKAWELGLFVQDSFKVSPRLSVDYGLRWEYFGAGTFDDGLMYNWDPSTANVVVPESAKGSVSPLYPTSIGVVTGEVVQRPRKTNYRPRFGISYRLRDNTVLRGGYSSFTEQIGRYALMQGGGPYQLSESFFNEITNGTALFQFPNPFPAFPGSVPSQSVSGYPLDTHNGNIHQMNLSLEQQWHDIGFRFSYINARNRGLLYSQNINKPQPSLTPFSSSRRPNPQFVGTTLYKSKGDTNYDAFQFEVQRKVGAVTFDSHYTWAHGASNYLNLENPYAQLFWNQDSTTPRHRVVMNVGWQLPFGRGQRHAANAPRAVDAVIGGWTLYYVGFLNTGQRFTPRFSGSDPSNTNTFGGLPDRIGDGNLPAGQRTQDRWFDASAFKVPVKGVFGNSGINILEGPGYNTHHLTVSKKFNLFERWQFQYSCQISNIFNHPNFYFPNSNISIPSVGLIESDVSIWDLQKGGARMVEMKLRVDF